MPGHGAEPAGRHGGRVIRLELDWMDWGRCREHPTEFFPDRGQRAAPAKAVCVQCPVREPCLAYALHHEIVDGVWGGLGAQERLGIIEARRRAAPSRDGGDP